MNTRVSVQEFVVAVSLDDAIARFLAVRRLQNLSDGTLDRYAQDFRLWTRWRQKKALSPFLPDITIEELRAYFTYLRDEHVPHSTNPHRLAPSHAGLMPSTIQGHWKLLHAAWVFWTEEELLSDRQVAFFARGRVPAPRVPLLIRPTYDPSVLAALLTADGPKQRAEATRRDRTILLMLYDSGMRVAELCGMADEDVHERQRQAIVTGKGNKQRYVFWTHHTQIALDAYLQVRSGETGGPLFRGVGNGGRARKSAGRQIGPGAVRDIIERRAERAGVLLPASAVHALRHTFAHRFLDNGGDGLHLQQLLGHELIVTTMRYVRENPTGLRDAYRRGIGE